MQTSPVSTITRDPELDSTINPVYGAVRLLLKANRLGREPGFDGKDPLSYARNHATIRVSGGRRADHTSAAIRLLSQVPRCKPPGPVGVEDANLKTTG